MDEAHHLRNRNTQAWKFASEIQKQFILLLTATPVQNNLEELFNLVTLLEPGLLNTARQFQRHFMDKRDKLTPRNVDELHELLAEVMIRNRRSTVGLQFTRRWARTESLSLSPPEHSLYQDVTEFVRDHLRAAQARQAEKGKDKGKEGAGLEPHGALEPPDGDGQLEPGGGRHAPQNRRATQTGRPAIGLGSQTWPSVLWRSTRAPRSAGCSACSTKSATRWSSSPSSGPPKSCSSSRLKEAGHDVAVFHGGLSRLEKEAAIEQFRGPARLLLCTEAGSEGRNLQFAHAVCNFDLPWNPMKIEQRIGRLSRIGQTHDVYVFNLVAADTVEAAVLHLLEAKLNMFELVIGEVDMILGNLEDEREFPDVVADLWAESADQDDFARRIDDLGDRLLEAKRAYFEQRALDDKLFGSRFAPDQ